MAGLSAFKAVSRAWVKICSSSGNSGFWIKEKLENLAKMRKKN